MLGVKSSRAVDLLVGLQEETLLQVVSASHSKPAIPTNPNPGVYKTGNLLPGEYMSKGHEVLLLGQFKEYLAGVATPVGLNVRLVEGGVSSGCVALATPARQSFELGVGPLTDLPDHSRSQACLICLGIIITILAPISRVRSSAMNQGGSVAAMAAAVFVVVAHTQAGRLWGKCLQKTSFQNPQLAELVRPPTENISS